MGASMLCGLSAGGACSRSLETSNMGMSESFRVEPRSAGEWMVEVRRECEGHEGLGRAVVRSASAPTAEQEPYARLAGARAWLSLGQDRLAAGQAQVSVACARRGLDELGLHYAPLTAGDDTVLKLAAAEEELAAGRAENAASTMLRTLDARTRLYVEKHRDAVVE